MAATLVIGVLLGRRVGAAFTDADRDLGMRIAEHRRDWDICDEAENGWAR